MFIVLIRYAMSLVILAMGARVHCWRKTPLVTAVLARHISLETTVRRKLILATGTHASTMPRALPLTLVLMESTTTLPPVIVARVSPGPIVLKISTNVWTARASMVAVLICMADIPARVLTATMDRSVKLTLTIVFPVRVQMAVHVMTVLTSSPVTVLLPIMWAWFVTRPSTRRVRMVGVASMECACTMIHSTSQNVSAMRDTAAITARVITSHVSLPTVTLTVPKSVSLTPVPVKMATLAQSANNWMETVETPVSMATPVKMVDNVLCYQTRGSANAHKNGAESIVPLTLTSVVSPLVGRVTALTWLAAMSVSVGLVSPGGTVMSSIATWSPVAMATVPVVDIVSVMKAMPGLFVRRKVSLCL